MADTSLRSVFVLPARRKLRLGAAFDGTGGPNPVTTWMGPDEALIAFPVDMSDELGPLETLSAVSSVTCYASSAGAAYTVVSGIVQSSAISGQKVIVTLSNAIDGTTYELKVVCTTSETRTVEVGTTAIACQSFQWSVLAEGRTGATIGPDELLVPVDVDFSDELDAGETLSAISGVTCYSHTGGAGDGGTWTPVTSIVQASATTSPVTGLLLTDPGFGYFSDPGIVLSGGGGLDASATAQVANGRLTLISIFNAGSQYTTAPTLTIDAPPASSSASFGAVTIVSGTIKAIAVASPGAGYDPLAPPTVAITDGTGSGAIAVAVLVDGGVSKVDIYNRGMAYSSSPTVTIDAPPSGVQATGTASVLITRATLQLSNAVAGTNYAFKVLCTTSSGRTVEAYTSSITAAVSP